MDTSYLECGGSSCQQAGQGCQKVLLLPRMDSLAWTTVDSTGITWLETGGQQAARAVWMAVAAGGLSWPYHVPFSYCLAQGTRDIVSWLCQPGVMIWPLPRPREAESYVLELVLD